MKKSQHLKNKGVTFSLSNNNAKLKLDSLGNVELKYISYGDTQNIAKLLPQKISDKEFVLKVLFQQLLKPKIDFAKFEKIPDKELEKLGKAFVKKEDYTFKHFKKTGDFFKDFRRALQDHYVKHIKELRKTFEPIVKSTQDTLKAFEKNYSSVIQQALDASSYIKDTMRQFTSITEQFQKTQLQLAESIKPIIEQYNATARILAESVKPQIEIWQKWAEQNQSVFQNISKQWADFQKKYKIAEDKAVGILQKYKWFISPSMPIDFIFEVVQIGQKKGRQDRAINKLFVDYFSKNNWRNLEILVTQWDKNTLITKRIKIIKDCLQTLKETNNKTNVVNVVLPTIIAQIDGFLTDYLDSKNISYDCAYDDFIQNGKVKKKGRKSQFKQSSSKALTSSLDDLANDIFLNILFQKSQKGKPLKTPFNFNRHKIMHGENVKYGRKDYLIRSFLLIDFLVSLK